MQQYNLWVAKRIKGCCFELFIHRDHPLMQKNEFNLWPWQSPWTWLIHLTFSCVMCIHTLLFQWHIEERNSFVEAENMFHWTSSLNDLSTLFITSFSIMLTRLLYCLWKYGNSTVQSVIEAKIICFSNGSVCEQVLHYVGNKI